MARPQRFARAGLRCAAGGAHARSAVHCRRLSDWYGKEYIDASRTAPHQVECIICRLHAMDAVDCSTFLPAALPSNAALRAQQGEWDYPRGHMGLGHSCTAAAVDQGRPVVLGSGSWESLDRALQPRGRGVAAGGLLGGAALGAARIFILMGGGALCGCRGAARRLAANGWCERVCLPQQRMHSQWLRGVPQPLHSPAANKRASWVGIVFRPPQGNRHGRTPRSQGEIHRSCKPKSQKGAKIEHVGSWFCSARHTTAQTTHGAPWRE